MVALYRMVGISKQGYYKRLRHRAQHEIVTTKLLDSALSIRKRHHKMGCRKLYKEIKPEGIGRDRTEAILLANGFRIKRKRNFQRTTRPGDFFYPNRISGMSVTNINQLWVSDITYLPIGYKKHYYLTLIQDVYSRKIVGWWLSDSLSSEQTAFPALERAFGVVDSLKIRGLIFHSDRGSQYIYWRLKDLYGPLGVQPSMGGKAWENAHAESINGVLKGEYLDYLPPSATLHQARRVIKSIIHRYNYERPHGSLKGMKPAEFERHIRQLKEEDRPIFKINY